MGPVDNVREQRYPNILILAGLHDPRVAYWEPAKWAQKLRSHQDRAIEFEKTEPKKAQGAGSDEGGDILLKTDLEVGHFSASDRYKYYWETSFDQAFVLDKLGCVNEF